MINLGSFHSNLNAPVRISPCLHKQSTLCFTWNAALKAPSLNIFSLIEFLHFRLLSNSRHLEISPNSVAKILGSLTISLTITFWSNPNSLNSPTKLFNLPSTLNPRTLGIKQMIRSISPLRIPIPIRNSIVRKISSSFENTISG